MPASPTIAYKILVKTPAPKIHVSKFHEKTPTKNQFNEPRIIIDRAIMFAIIISSPPLLVLVWLFALVFIRFIFSNLSSKSLQKLHTAKELPQALFFKINNQSTLKCSVQHFYILITTYQSKIKQNIKLLF